MSNRHLTQDHTTHEARSLQGRWIKTGDTLMDQSKESILYRGHEIRKGHDTRGTIFEATEVDDCDADVIWDRDFDDVIELINDYLDPDRGVAVPMRQATKEAIQLGWVKESA